MGWTDWTHGTRSGAAPPPPPPPPPGPEPPPPPGGTAPSEQPAPLLPDSGDTTPPDGEVRPGLGRRDNTAPRVSVRIRRRQSLRPAARGLIARVHCSERCGVRVRVLLDPGTARSTGLSSSRRWVRLGSKHFLIRRAGGRRVVVRFAPRARAKLRRAQRATLRLHFSVSDRAGNSRLVSRRVALRR